MSVNVSLAAIPAAVTEFIRAPHGLLIDGKWVLPSSGQTFTTHNPADGSALAEIAAADATDVDLAVQAARRAFDDGPWSKMTPAARAKLIWRLADALEANSTSYGLGAVLWTQNLSTAHKMAGKLKAGTVRVNGGGLDPALPFGGFKQSGWGRELGREGIEAYTELKSVAMAL